MKRSAVKILSINQEITHPKIDIHTISFSQLATLNDIQSYDYIIIHGGDGSIRRTVKVLHSMTHNATFILNPSGSFNVIAKQHKVPKLEKLLEDLVNDVPIKYNTQDYHSLNDEIFLFSAGNMGDLHHIFLAESLRFGFITKGMFKYVLAVLLLLPVHLLLTPFMLMSRQKFFIFTPLRFIKKFGSFYGEVKEIEIDLKNDYNIIELDGDIVTITQSVLKIKKEGHITIAI